MFRPCIDLHAGKVKQIVGSSLRDDGAALTNFETDRSGAWYADLYRRDNLGGGHIIMLGPENEAAAREALAAFPGGMQIGGGINPQNALQWLKADASHVIVTSYVFREGRIDWERLDEIRDVAGTDRLVLDLSCKKIDGEYRVVTDRWQNPTTFALNAPNLARLAQHAAEFLVHAADVEGMRQGPDLGLVALLAEHSPLIATYAGGIATLGQMRQVLELGRGRIHATIGSALDIFGGNISYRDVVALSRSFEPDRP